MKLLWLNHFQPKCQTDPYNTEANKKKLLLLFLNQKIFWGISFHIQFCNPSCDVGPK